MASTPHTRIAPDATEGCLKADLGAAAAPTPPTRDEPPVGLSPFSIEQMIQDHLEPRVPAHLMRFTCGIEAQDEFVRSGAEIYTMLDLAARRYRGRPIVDFHRTLDFGCGNGRILRFLRNASGEIHGCDVSRAGLDFVRENLPFVKIYRNPLMPPLHYAAGSFDLIVSFSVFSHLSLAVENAWLTELARCGAAGCLYLLSVQGDWWIEDKFGPDAAAVKKAGFTWHVVRPPRRKATWKDRAAAAIKAGVSRGFRQRDRAPDDFPAYYETSYHASDYIRNEWSRYFDILDVIRGDDPMHYVEHDRSLHDLARQLRPMGQDLVVARKR
jgi:SAM-dependent methyltransferase